MTKIASPFPKSGGAPSHEALRERGTDSGGIVIERTMSLSTPLVSAQDGPRMAGFAGKKAAPFVKGGGRSKDHSNDAKGNKRKAAKAAIAKAALKKG